MSLTSRESSLNMLQWNARSAVANKPSLEKTLFEQNIHVAIICETWFQPGKFENFPGYNIIREDRNDGKAGAAIFLKSNIVPNFQIHDFYRIPNQQCCAINVTSNGKPINIVSFYNSCTNNTTSQEWLRFFNSFHGATIFGGDTNCHHIAWGCGWTDAKGRSLLDAMDEANLLYLNTGEPTLKRSVNHVHVSAVDLTIVSADIGTLFDWKVMDDSLGSNHYPIKITAENMQIKSVLKKQIRKWKIGSADWKIFQSEMNKLIRENSENEKTYENFTTYLNRACEKSIPRVSHFNENVNFRRPWWDESCRKLMEERRMKLAIYKTTLALEDFLEYTKSDANFKKYCKKSKRRAWQSFCNSLNRHVKIKEVWNSIKRLKNRKTSPSFPIEEGQWSEDLFNSLCPPYVSQDVPILPPVSQEEEQNEMSKIFSIQELNRSIKSNTNTAPGMDNIHYPMIHNLPNVARQYLLDVLNNIWITGKIPEEWRNITVVPFLKPGKSPENYKSFRPISLASCMLKTFERMVKHRLDWWFENNNILSMSQFGFRKCRSVTDAQASLVLEIERGFSEDKSTLAVFYDVEGAYSAVQIPILINKLICINTPPRLIRIIYSIISHRYLYLRINNNLTGPRTTWLGLGQGFILSCPLYTLYTSDLRISIPPEILITEFVDDICISYTGKLPETCVTEIKNGMLAVEKFMTDNGLKISYQKSESVLFSRKRRLNVPESLSVNEFEIPINKTVRFLGLILERKLNWTNHIEHAVSKSAKYINMMKSVCNKHWGMDPKIALTFYRATIRSTLDFGSIFYVNSAKSKLQRVHTTQSKAIRVAMGYLNSTPIDVMLQESREMSIVNRAQLLVDRFVLKTLATQRVPHSTLNELTISHLTSKKLKKRSSPPLVESYSNVSKYNTKIFSSDKPPTYLFEYQTTFACVERGNVSLYESAPDHAKQNYFQHEIKEKWPQGHMIFTDGSKLEKSVGSAFYDPQSKNGKGFRLQDFATIFTAEAFAILQALKYAKTLHKNEILIISDSRSSLDGLSNATHNGKLSHLILEILEELMNLQKQNISVKFIWVRGHAGISGNEMADHLAKEAARSSESPLPYLIPVQDARASIDLEHQLKWRTNIRNTENNKGLFHKKLFDVTNKRTWFHKAPSYRKFIVTLNRLRSNHAICNAYLHRINIAPTNLCDACNEREDLEHIIMCCQKYTIKRKDLFKRIEDKLELPFNYATILQNKNCYIPIFQFLIQQKITT